ncbi:MULTISPECIES: NUDIX domain-containing protein [unclassified Oceanispirochaeta]|uniref:NUDIX hydrolase n=1 Tax=unclassified Oceanispirochaeta TaxID=2635722 RepID=UPI000E092A73|nr:MULTISPECIES: NUDIX domain-containing protein [unclassified Oceanispirochaeta]MBF9018813.1 NUDIX domain-containing protein [Oceanispirochaeta sp. M2]NPD75282.1 NUDIX domain-containing protein [Oceanispirochaeta sp. M1]RDG28873.1 NUDIX domain-containing protein [Oceanispirochaeta sp. M1]
MEILDLYDENRTLINKKIIRGESLNPGEYHLVIHFWIYNDLNQLLIQKRNKPPEEFGGIWACTGGTTIAGENSETTAIREMKEEMGIDIKKNELSIINTRKEENYILDVFISKWNGSIDDVVIDPEEVLDAMWISIDKLETMIENRTFFDYGKEYLEAVFSHIEENTEV